MQKTKWKWSEESERDGVGRRPAVLFSPAVQTRDMWLSRQAVQSGRARWTHYRQGQDGIAWQNTIIRRIWNGQTRTVLVLCEHVCACRCLFGTACFDNCPSLPSVCATPGCPHPPPPVDMYTHTHTHTHTHTLHTTRSQTTLSRPGQKDCLNVCSCTGQLSDEVASHRLPLEIDSEEWLDLEQQTSHRCQFIIVLLV